jgi:ketosteroid isomerase-like protein
VTSDEQQVVNLLADYCWYVDRRDVDAVVALFAPDATFDLGFGRVHRGHDELREMYERVDAYTATSHHITTPRLDLSGDTGSVRSAMYAFHRRPDGSQLHLWGAYLDEVARAEGGWRFTARTLRASAEEGALAEEEEHATRFEHLPRR